MPNASSVATTATTARNWIAHAGPGREFSVDRDTTPPGTTGCARGEAARRNHTVTWARRDRAPAAIGPLLALGHLACLRSGSSPPVILSPFAVLRVNSAKELTRVAGDAGEILRDARKLAAQ